MMHPVLRVLLDRADARRGSLLGLAEAVPGDYWARTAPGDAWSAWEHFAHALSADELLLPVLERSRSGRGPIDLGAGDSFAFEREAALRRLAALDFRDAVARAAGWRRRLVEALSDFEPTQLERPLLIPGVRSAWGEPLAVSLYGYLEQWAAHDGVHEAAIREAMLTPPDLSAVMLAKKRMR